MHKQVPPALLILASFAFAPIASAIEPDGRVAFRTAWTEAKDGESPRLVLTMTAVSALTDARLVAKLPDDIALSLHGESGVTAWPHDGLAVGTLAAGQVFKVEFDVTRPELGGGIVGFALEANFQGRAVTEGVGVPVGVPGAKPTLRDGAVEFPALELDGTP